MKIQKMEAGMVQTNVYLVTNEETQETVVVDPAYLTDEIKYAIDAQGLKIKAIILTHGHFDHIMGIDQFEQEYGELPVYVHEDDVETMRDPVINQSAAFIRRYAYVGAQPVQDGQTLTLAGMNFKVIHTPGHTPGGACYYIEEEQVLFSGDTLFRRSVGRTDFVKSSTSDLLESINKKLFNLPGDVRVYPGHMGETSIGFEKRYNPYVY